MVLKINHTVILLYTLYLMNAFCATVVRINLSRTAYEMLEDAGSIEICATLSGPDIERSLMVFLITSEDTAQGSCDKIICLP